MTAADPGRFTVDCDVVIVGFGPVGSTLAILLAQLDRRVVVLERWLEPYPLPRAVHFDHEVGRILQGCGIGPALADITEPAEVYEWRNGAGTTLLRFGRVGAGASGWPESSMFNQPALEGLLDERARAMPGIDVRRGVEVTALDQSADGVVVSGKHANGEIVQVRCHYAIGCDGANSTVRTIVGAPMVDLGLLLRLADRRRHPRRAPGLRSGQPAGLRPRPADHGGVGRPGAATVGVHAPAPRKPRGSR